MKRLSVLVLSAAMSWGCGGETVIGPDGEPIRSAIAMEGFSIRTEDGQLVLKNGTVETIHYVAVEAETSTRIDLHYDPESWPAIQAGLEVRIPYDRITGYHPGDEVGIVHWWTAGRYRPWLAVALR